MLVHLLLGLADVLLDFSFRLLSAALQMFAAIVDGIAEVAAHLADGFLDVPLISLAMPLSPMLLFLSMKHLDTVRRLRPAA